MRIFKGTILILDQKPNYIVMILGFDMHIHNEHMKQQVTSCIRSFVNV